MKSKKKIVLAGLVLLATALLLPLAGCKNDTVLEAEAKYTVTFKANGGTFADGKDTKTETVESGNAATKPTDPTDPTNGDMVLAGWYTSEDDGETLADTAYSFDTPVEGDIILYAAWNGRDSDGNIVLKNKVMSKTREEQVSTGTFQMGSTAGYTDEKPVHGVTISKGYFMGQYEVTQQLYEAVMGSNPSNFDSDVETGELQELRPVEQVSWYDAVVFCNELTKKVLGEGACVYYSDTGLKTVYTTGDGASEKTPYRDTSKSGYRLPTEAEWEYAARAGDDTTNARTWSGTKTDADLGKYAWYSKNSGSKTHQVGTLLPNEWGLHDMSGNVWEWCWDWFGDYSDESVSDPHGGSSGVRRVSRGGGWDSSANFCSVSGRNYSDPNYRSVNFGFRLVRSAN